MPSGCCGRRAPLGASRSRAFKSRTFAANVYPVRWRETSSAYRLRSATPRGRSNYREWTPPPICSGSKPPTVPSTSSFAGRATFWSLLIAPESVQALSGSSLGAARNRSKPDLGLRGPGGSRTGLGPMFILKLRRRWYDSKVPSIVSARFRVSGYGSWRPVQVTRHAVRHAPVPSRQSTIKIISARYFHSRRGSRVSS